MDVGLKYSFGCVLLDISSFECYLNSNVSKECAGDFTCSRVTLIIINIKIYGFANQIKLAILPVTPSRR